MFILLISIFFSLSASLENLISQEFFWVPQKMVYAKEADKIYVFGEDKLTVIDPETLMIRSIRDFYLGPEIEKTFLNFKFFEWENTLVAIDKGGGRIYKFEEDHFDRIDRSVISYGLNDGFSFQHRDTLFRYGGYGFWKASHHLIYFDKNTRQWEIYPINKSSEVPPEFFGIAGYYHNNILYTFHGTSVNPYNPKENSRVNDFWKFDFSEKTWAKVPKQAFLKEPLNTFIVPSAKGFYLQLNSKILQLEAEQNTFKLFEPNPLFFRAVNRDDLLCFSETDAFFITLSTNGFRIEKASLDYFLAKPILTGSYRPNWTPYYGAAALLVVVLVLAMIWRQRKKQNTFIFYLHSEEIRYKSKRFNINPQQHSVLIELIENKEVLASKIKDLVYRPELSNAQNERNKLLIIQNLNIEFKRLISQDVILEQKSPIDKRIKLYTLASKVKMVVKKS